MKILIVGKPFFPIISPRSFRTTELAKEFIRLGHEVTVCVADNGYSYDNFLKKYPIRIIFGGKQNGFIDSMKSKSSNRHGLQYLFFRTAQKITNYLFEYPGFRGCSLIHKVLKNESNFDVLISIANPYSVHFAVCKAMKRNPQLAKRWISDCGDPFTGSPMGHHAFYWKYIEKWWAKATDFITIPIEEGKIAYHKECRGKIRIIPQGFNFDEINLAEYHRNTIPTFAYAGAILRFHRDPSNFLNYLLTLQFDFKFIVYTRQFEYFVKCESLLGNKLECRSFIPREELLLELSKMDFLIDIKNESSLHKPSKLIDYALTKRPVLEISTAFKEQNNFDAFLKGDYSSAMEIKDISQYDIRNVANHFLSLASE
ncbi:MAG: hypothetical protein LBG80_17685 [Bacteroidales bacterium]|jgi:hypothetical protein|nr:hypothetical protein [Bacteroidales bacterium]